MYWQYMLGCIGLVIMVWNKLLNYIKHQTTGTNFFIVLTIKSWLSPCTETWGKYYIVLYKCNFSHDVVRMDHCVLATYGRFYRLCHCSLKHAKLLHWTWNCLYKIIYSIDPKKLIVPLYRNPGQILYSTIQV